MLLARFCDGLSTEIQLELACRDEGLDLNSCIQLAIKLDQQGQHQHKLAPASRHSFQDFSLPNVAITPHIASEDAAWEAMDVSSSRLLAEEWRGGFIFTADPLDMDSPSVHCAKYQKSVSSTCINFECLHVYLCLTCLDLCVPM